MKMVNDRDIVASVFSDGNEHPANYFYHRKLNDPQFQHILPGPTEAVTCFSPLTDNEFLVGGRNATAKAAIVKYDLRSYAATKFSTGTTQITCLEKNPHNNLQFFAGNTGSTTIKLWDVRNTDKPVAELQGHKSYPVSISATENQNSAYPHLVSIADQEEGYEPGLIWDFKNSAPVAKFTHSFGRPTIVRSLKNGTLALCADCEDDIETFDLTTGEQLDTLHGSDYATCLSELNNGDLITSAIAFVEFYKTKSKKIEDDDLEDIVATMVDAADELAEIFW